MSIGGELEDVAEEGAVFLGLVAVKKDVRASEHLPQHSSICGRQKIFGFEIPGMGGRISCQI
jgi:hypothetical protein